MTNVIRVLIFTAVIPLTAASQADACWLCWKCDHPHLRASTYSSTGGGGPGELPADGGLTVNTESAEMPESAGLPTPLRTNQGSGAAAAGDAGAVGGVATASQTGPSETTGKLDKMSAQLDRIESQLNSPESAVVGTPESAIATMLLHRVGGKVLERVFKDLEDGLGGLGTAPAVPPTVETTHSQAEVKKLFISLLSDPDVKNALKKAVKD